jgi:hypothetical protein
MPVNAYKLDDKAMDTDFLDGKIVQCSAAVRESDLPTMPEGSSIVVLLSNGKKYRGTVHKFSYRVENGIATGSLEIEKARK